MILSVKNFGICDRVAPIMIEMDLMRNAGYQCHRDGVRPWIESSIMLPKIQGSASSAMEPDSRYAGVLEPLLMWCFIYKLCEATSKSYLRRQSCSRDALCKDYVQWLGTSSDT